MNRIHIINIAMVTAIEEYMCCTVKIYKNNPHKKFRGWGAGARVLDLLDKLFDVDLT